MTTMLTCKRCQSLPTPSQAEGILGESHTGTGVPSLGLKHGKAQYHVNFGLSHKFRASCKYHRCMGFLLTTGGISLAFLKDLGPGGAKDNHLRSGR